MTVNTAKDILNNITIGDYTWSYDATANSINIAYDKTKETTMKNVLFLAPSYPYAKTVVENLHKGLNRYDIPHTSSIATKNVYLKTEDVMVEFIYMDPVKYTPDIFLNRDKIFGKEKLVEEARDKYPHLAIHLPRMSVDKYIREAYEYSRRRGVDLQYADGYKPRTTYIPEIANVYFNDPVTVVLWSDGTKTTVRCQEGDVYSKEVGLSLCVTKKALGNMPNFNNIFRKWCPEEKMETVGSTTTIVDTGEYTTLTDAAMDLREAIKRNLSKLVEDL